MRVSPSLQSTYDALHYAFNIRLNFIVPEPYDSKPIALKPHCPLLIGRPNARLIVLSAVELNNQPMLETHEVNNVRSDRLLPSETSPRLLVCSLDVPTGDPLRKFVYDAADVQWR